jgi:hypothetical protein
MRLILAACLAFGVSAAAFAQTTATPAQGANVCRAEIERVCGAQKAQGREAVRACVQQNRSQFSQACQDQMAKKAQGRDNRGEKKKGQRQAAEACRADVQRLCANVQPGEGRIMQCLKQNQAQLSQPCKDAAAQAGQKKKG